jgi:hypothetical protein
MCSVERRGYELILDNAADILETDAFKNMLGTTNNPLVLQVVDTKRYL